MTAKINKENKKEIFQNKWAGILSQKHGKPFVSWQKRLHNDEVNVRKFYIAYRRV